MAKDQVDVRYTTAKFNLVIVVDGLSGCFWSVFLWKGSEMRHPHFFLSSFKCTTQRSLCLVCLGSVLST